eukprot:gene10020-10175_t
MSAPYRVVPTGYLVKVHHGLKVALFVASDAILDAYGGVDVEDVVQLLDDFYRLKRLGFRECLEELGEEPAVDA